MTAATKNFNDRWKGEGGVMAYHIPEYYSYTEDAAPGFSVQGYEEKVLGIHEKIGLENGGDGFHDDYYISAFVIFQSGRDTFFFHSSYFFRSSVTGFCANRGNTTEMSSQGASGFPASVKPRSSAA